MSIWINNKKVIDAKAEKPCHKLGWCPYGQLVEEFPLVHGKFSCKVFGHDCPVFYHKENLKEEICKLGNSKG